MVKAMHRAAVEESNKELLKLKGKWEIENRCSGDFEIPSNILELEGVEYLLKLNTFNEVPSVLLFVAPYLVEYSLTSNSSNYSAETKEVYVKKGSELIERLLGLYKELGVNLKTATGDLFVASALYINYLATAIGKSKEYNI